MPEEKTNKQHNKVYSCMVFCIRKYGANALDQLIRAGMVSVKSVFTKKENFHYHPNCEEICSKHKIPFTYIDQWDESVLKDILSVSVDFILSAWFHLKFPDEIIQAPAIGAVNFHPSILPKYRGANPVEWAIVNGEKETGISAHIIEEEMDAGMEPSLPFE